MRRLFLLMVFATQIVCAQKTKNSAISDKTILANLQLHISYLADDKLEGRLTGSPGEKLAYEYISNQFKTVGLLARGDNGSYIQAFEVNEGKQINKLTRLTINGFNLVAEKDFFPFIFSANGNVETSTTIALPESGTTWFWDLKEILEENKNNPHFDLTDAIRTKANDIGTKRATALVVYNSSSISDELKFEPKAKAVAAKIPAVYITNNMKKRFLKDESASVDIKLTVDIGNKIRTGHNVIGFIDNGAPNTVIIGAHYDHLGYGEDHTSLYTGSTPQIHNGADDNASGTAALIELAKLLKGSAFKNNNYLFISFSGEELGLFGSKYYAEHPVVDLGKTNYMVNMDMVGRLSDSTHGLNIGGYGTSATWGELLSEKDNFFKIKFDSSGRGPSDHTSFYAKDIPVLFFFTGVHSDYHKPSDDADKINNNGELLVLKYIYNVIAAADKKGKLPFSKTRDTQSGGKSSFKVSLGIMPDYTYSGGGIRVDGVSEGKLAQRVGIKAGDIILQLGEHKFSDMQSYMDVLKKFNKGDATKVRLRRGTEEMEIDIIF